VSTCAEGESRIRPHFLRLLGIQYLRYVTAVKSPLYPRASGDYARPGGADLLG
jgi:hypothetical protein